MADAASFTDMMTGTNPYRSFRFPAEIIQHTVLPRLRHAANLTPPEKRRCSERPPRDEYVLTERSRDLRGVLLSLMAYGNRHFSPVGARVMLVDAVSGAPADPVLVDRNSGRPVAAPDFKVVPGLASSLTGSGKR